VLLARYYEGDQIEEDEICRACGRMRWQNDIKKKLAPSSILREAKIAYYARNMFEAGRFFAT